MVMSNQTINKEKKLYMTSSRRDCRQCGKLLATRHRGESDNAVPEVFQAAVDKSQEVNW